MLVSAGASPLYFLWRNPAIQMSHTIIIFFNAIIISIDIIVAIFVITLVVVILYTFPGALLIIEMSYIVIIIIYMNTIFTMIKITTTITIIVMPSLPFCSFPGGIPPSRWLRATPNACNATILRLFSLAHLDISMEWGIKVKADGGTGLSLASKMWEC